MEPHLTDEQILLAALFPICSLAGLAALLREGKQPTRMEILSAILNSGLFGVAIGALLLQHYGWDAWRLVFGISILSGLGANVLLVYVISLMKQKLAKWFNGTAEK